MFALCVGKRKMGKLERDVIAAFKECTGSSACGEKVLEESINICGEGEHRNLEDYIHRRNVHSTIRNMIRDSLVICIQLSVEIGDRERFSGAARSVGDSATTHRSRQ